MTEKEIEQLRKELRGSIIINVKLDFLKSLKEIKEYISIDPVLGPVLNKNVLEKLNQREQILYFLFSLRAASELLEESEKNGLKGSVTSEDIRERLPVKTKKGVLARLSELMRENFVANVSEEVGKGRKARYKISDYGVQHFVREVTPKIKGGGKNEGGSK